MSNIVYYTECTSHFDCGDGAFCQNSFCVCKPTFYEINGKCHKCPGLGQLCEDASCCSNISMICAPEGVCVCQNGAQNSLTCRYLSSQTPIYITASQIALSAALIMGMAALTMVVYRLCTKPRYLTARQRALASRAGLNLDNDSMSYANYLRASLTSIQIRVLTRLRDRPPSYDSRQTPQILPEAPPPYEGVSEGLPLPPPYLEIVLNPSGYINSTFVNSETGLTVNRNTESDSVSNRNPSTDTVNNNCDNNNQSTENDRGLDKIVEDAVDEKAETTAENRIPT